MLYWSVSIDAFPCKQNLNVVFVPCEADCNNYMLLYAVRKLNQEQIMIFFLTNPMFCPNVLSYKCSEVQYIPK